MLLPSVEYIAGAVMAMSANAAVSHGAGERSSRFPSTLLPAISATIDGNASHKLISRPGMSAFTNRYSGTSSIGLCHVCNWAGAMSKP